MPETVMKFYGNCMYLFDLTHNYTGTILNESVIVIIKDKNKAKAQNATLEILMSVQKQLNIVCKTTSAIAMSDHSG